MMNGKLTLVAVATVVQLWIVNGLPTKKENLALALSAYGFPTMHPKLHKLTIQMGENTVVTSIAAEATSESEFDLKLRGIRNINVATSIRKRNDELFDAKLHVTIGQGEGTNHKPLMFYTVARSFRAPYDAEKDQGTSILSTKSGIASDLLDEAYKWLNKNEDLKDKSNDAL